MKFQRGIFCLQNAKNVIQFSGVWEGIMDNNYDKLEEELKKQALDNELKANGVVVP